MAVAQERLLRVRAELGSQAGQLDSRTSAGSAGAAAAAPSPGGCSVPCVVPGVYEDSLD